MGIVGSLGQMIQDSKNGVVDFTQNGSCSNCGQCCTNFLPMSVNEIANVKKYIFKNKIKEQKRAYPTANVMIDMVCPFRDEIDKKCTIYEVRPLVCRMFKCDKTTQEINEAKHFFTSKKYRVVDVRKKFYENE